jgi:type IV pilus assembly protein PilC
VPSFEYTASDRTGSITKGSLEAKDKAAASRELGSMGLFVLEIKPASGGPKSSSGPARSATPKADKSAQTVRSKASKPVRSKKPAAPPPPKAEPTRVLTTVVSHASDTPKPSKKAEKKKAKLPFQRVSLTPLQRALYLRQLYTMFAAGIPLHQATEILTENDDYRPELRAALLGVPSDLERGRLLSKALKRSGLFNRLIVSSIHVGETSGRLDSILQKLADGEEQSVKLKRTLISKLTYPAVVMVIMSLGLLVLGHVMSRVMSSMPGFDPGDIPLFGIATSVFQHPTFLPICAILMAGLAFLCWKTYMTPAWRLRVEAYLLHLPMLGQLIRRVESNTVTGQLSLLISAGIPLDRALELCSDLVWTEQFRRAMVHSKTEIRNGVAIVESFEMCGLFPQDVLALIAAGELSGALEGSLEKAATYCADQVERNLETALSLLEPLLIGSLGIAIGTVILCTFVPVFNQIQTM